MIVCLHRLYILGLLFFFFSLRVRHWMELIGEEERKKAWVIFSLLFLGSFFRFLFGLFYTNVKRNRAIFFSNPLFERYADSVRVFRDEEIAACLHVQFRCNSNLQIRYILFKEVLKEAVP